MIRRFFLSVILLTLIATAAHAVRPDEILPDPALESRARVISRELRCLVCQNESIDDSNADLAHDLRVLVRERLKTGDSDRQAVQYIVDRYGQYVLLKPPFEKNTLILWLCPLFTLIAAVWLVISFYRRRKVVLATLTAEEEQKVEKLLKESRKDQA